MSGLGRFDRVMRERSQRQPRKNPVYSGFLGITTGGAETVEIDSRPGFVWVRLRNVDNEVIQAFNEDVSPIYNLPVLVERDLASPTRYKIVGRDIGVYGSNWGTASPYLSPHAGQHMFNKEDVATGGDIVWIYTDQFLPFLVSPSGTASGGSANVLIFPGIYHDCDGNYRYAGNTGTASLYTCKPTGTNNAKMCLVYLERATGNFLLECGTLEFGLGISGTANLLQYIPPVPEGGTALAGIRLVSGTSTIGWNDIIDLREFVHADICVTGSSGGGGHTIQDDGINQTQRTNLNFVGSAFVVSDDVGNDATIVSGTAVPGPAGPPGDNTLLIYDDSAFKVTGTAISFDYGLDVYVTGSYAYVDSTVDLYNVINYGAVGDGAVDDTSAIQSAIDAAEANSGGLIYFPEGEYKVSGIEIASSDIHLAGTGDKSTIAMSAADGDTVDIENSSTRNHVKISNIRFKPSVERTSGAEISAENFAVLTLENLHFAGTAGDINSCIDLGATGRNNSVAFLSNIRANDFDRFIYAVRVIDLIVNNCSTDANIAGANSIILEGGCESGIFVNCDFVNSANNDASGTGNCLTLRDTDYSTSPPRYLYFSNCFFDSHQRGVYATAGQDITFNGCWFSDRPGGGAVLNDSSCDQFSFVGCRFENCGGHGATINDGSNLLFTGCSFISNDQQAGGSHGIYLASVDGFIFTNNICTNRGGFGGAQEYGIYINSGCDDFIIKDNDLRGNNTGEYSNQVPTVNYCIEDNVMDTGIQRGAGARVYNSANISISNSTATALTFNSERYDYDSIHSTVANTDRMTIVTAGIYNISGHVEWDASGVGQRAIFIRLNGTTNIAVQSGDARSSGNHEMSVSTNYELSNGDYVTLMVWQNSGGNLNVVTSGNDSPEFSIQKIG